MPKFVSRSPRYARRPDSSSVAYLASLRDPFSPQALGAKIPDSYSFPTETSHCRTNITVWTNTIGTFTTTYYVNPLYNFVLGTGSATGIVFAPCNFIGGPCSVAALQNLCTSYRVVSYGLRVSNRQAPGSAIGVIRVAQIPALTTFPSASLIEAMTSTTTNLNLVNMGGTGIVSSGGTYYGIENLPDADIFTVQELMSQDLLIQAKMVSPHALDYRGVQRKNGTAQVSIDSVSYDVIDYGNDVIATSTSGVSTLSGDRTMTDSSGWTAIIIQGTGFPVNTAALNVEVIIHLEMSPFVNASPSFVNSVPGNSPVDSSIFQQGQQIYSSLPCARLLSSERVHRPLRQIAQGAFAVAKRFVPPAGRVLATVGKAAVRRYGPAIAGRVISKFDKLVANKLGLPIPRSGQ